MIYNTVTVWNAESGDCVFPGVAWTRPGVPRSETQPNSGSSANLLARAALISLERLAPLWALVPAVCQNVQSTGYIHHSSLGVGGSSVVGLLVSFTTVDSLILDQDKIDDDQIIWNCIQLLDSIYSVARLSTSTVLRR